MYSTQCKSLSCDYHVTLHLQLKPVGAAMLADGAVMHLLDYFQFDCPDNHGSFVTVEALGRLALKAGLVVSAHTYSMCTVAMLEQALGYQCTMVPNLHRAQPLTYLYHVLCKLKVLLLHSTPPCMPMVALTSCNLHRGCNRRCVPTCWV